MTVVWSSPDASDTEPFTFAVRLPQAIVPLAAPNLQVPEHSENVSFAQAAEVAEATGVVTAPKVSAATSAAIAERVRVLIM
jgi:hypothetical protein